VLVSAPIGIARFAGVERLITQRERNRWCLAVAAAGPALLAADGEAGLVRAVAAALRARALGPRVEVPTGDLVNQPGVGMSRSAGRVIIGAAGWLVTVGG
jgi:hypothetical protein